MAKPLLDDELWEVIEPLLPPPKPRRFRFPGRQPLDNRKAVTGIIFVLKTGIPWESLPQEMGCGSGMTCWRRLRDWQEAGVWDRLQEVLLAKLQGAGQIDWSRAVVDSASVRAVGTGGKTGPNPTDRAKPGSKHHLLTDAGGIPLGKTLTGANTQMSNNFFLWSRPSRRSEANGGGPDAGPKSCTPTGLMTRSLIARSCASLESSRSWPSGAPGMGAVWGSSAGWWNVPCPGCISSDACVCATSDVRTFTRPSSPWLAA